jgi:anti-sigma B factor antagonist
MSLAELDVELLDRVVVARLEGEIDLSNAGDLGAAIAARVPNDALGVVIDLRQVDYVDSAGIHVLFDLRDRLRTRGQELGIVLSPEAKIFEALRLAFVPSVVRVFDSLEAAAAGVSEKRAGDH